MAKAKTIKLLLTDGTLNGLLMVEDNSWNGRMFASPRESINDLLERDDVNQYGVYILLSENQVYVGQASDLKKRINQHYGQNGKDWWERAVLFTTKDDSFNRSDIDFLETELIQKAQSLNTLHSDNKNIGNKGKVDEFRRTELEQYLDNSLLLLELIGIRVFADKTKRNIKRATNVSQTSRKGKSITSGTRNYSKLVGQTFFLKGVAKKTKTEYNATLIFEAEHKIIVKAGSTLNKLSPYANKETEKIDIARKANTPHNLQGLNVLKDIEFSNQNQAAQFIFGQAINAWDKIKDTDGKTIDEISRS